MYLDIAIIPDNKDDEESKNDTDVFTNPTKSMHVANSKNCDDDTSIQSSIRKYTVLHSKSVDFFCTLCFTCILHFWVLLFNSF